MRRELKTINWCTGGLSSKGWAYENNALRLQEEMQQYQHLLDGRNTSYDYILYFDILIYRELWKMEGKRILRLGGPRPLELAYKDYKEMNQQLSTFDAIIALSSKLYEIGSKANSKVYLLPNGLDLSFWQPAEKNKGKGTDFIVGFAGNISNALDREIKGFELVREACSRLKIGFKYQIKKKKQIIHHKMRDNFYYKIDCLVHPVRKGKEGSSNMIMEALACGVPVITTKEAGYHGERLEDRKNVLFCQREVEDIVACIELLRAEEELRTKLTAQGRLFAKKHHDIREIAEGYSSIFESC